MCVQLITCAQVRIKALLFEHDEQRSPAQKHCRTKQVFQHCCDGHPPAPPERLLERGSHPPVKQRKSLLMKKKQCIWETFFLQRFPQSVCRVVGGCQDITMQIIGYGITILLANTIMTIIKTLSYTDITELIFQQELQKWFYGVLLFSILRHNFINIKKTSVCTLGLYNETNPK